MERPRRQFELNVRVAGDTWDDVVRELHHLARHIEQHGPECSSVGGGYSTGHIVEIQHDPAMTGDKYREFLEQYLAEREGAA